MPYQIVGGTKFYERAEVKDALSYLRVLVNPQSDVDLLRVINTPARGIGQTTIERLVALATEKKIPVFAALERLDDAPEIGSAAHKRLRALHEMFEGLKKDAKTLSPASLLDVVLEKTGYKA